MIPSTPIENIKRIGPVYEKRLKKMGIKEVGDLLFHFPSRYQDFTNIVKIKDLQKGDEVTVQGHVTHINQRNLYKRGLKIVEAYIEDDTDTIKAVWFNQTYLTTTLDTKKTVMLSGKVGLGKDGLYLQNPIYEIKNLGEMSVHTGRLIPIYPETSGVSSRWFRYIISKLLPIVESLEEQLPKNILKQNNLLGIGDALQKIHFPKNTEEAEKARDRFVFENIFDIQLAALKKKRELKDLASPTIKTNIELTKKFVNSLPFQLTDSQKKSAWQILKDMERNFPMNRLLEGDVGSGKTVVSAIATLNAIDAGYQVAFMAPTEILATQHFKNLSELLKDTNANIALFTRGQRRLSHINKNINKEKLKAQIKEGAVNFIIGTHTLAQEGVEFKKLGLVILDEQHRFGVKQRASLVRRGKKNPHLLSMTATPIPRSLALTIYGDLDISLLKEMPHNRKTIITNIVPPEKRLKAYNFIKKELDSGHQAFVVFPLVEESKILELKSAKAEYEKLKEGPFKKYRVGLLHGRLKTKEKEEIMTQMEEGKIDILISTSVVEVGIDIPNATIMMIDGADRFGLAQLHQFRGRVGRAQHQSYAFLLTDSSGGSVMRRLKIIEKTQSGFELAQYDLKLRGPGEMYGVRQSGIPDIAMQNLGNIELIEKIREQADKLLEENPTLEKYPQLKQKIESIQLNVHLE